MADYKITNDEYVSAVNAVNSILTQAVEEIELSNELPLIDDVSDSNKVFKGKLSVLFVDMRKSTDLTDELKSKKMVKVYRAFIRMIIQAIRYSGGHTRQFAGDGIMGIFQDSTENEKTVLSSQKAVNAARYILTLIDYCLNPALKKHFDDVVIGCGLGICTGEIMITKVGMRGKEADETTENEMGIVWVGSTTNYASRFCGLAKPQEIFIDEKTHSEIDSDEIWQKSSRTKGSKLFKGYAANEFYAILPDGISQEPLKSEETQNQEETFIQEVFNETQERALLLVDEISKKSAELAVALENVKKRETQVSERENKANQENSRLIQWQSRLDSKQDSVKEKDNRNKQNEYDLIKSIFSKTYCKDSIIKEYGKDYWLKLINDMFSLGAKIGKSETQVKSDLDCYLVRMYMCFNMYEEAYNALCIQAEYSSWLNESTFKDVIEKSGHWIAIQNILERRTGKDHVRALQILKSLGH